MRDGKWTTWYENGKARSEINYKDNKLDGKSYKWKENGQSDSQINYKEGVCIGGDFKFYLKYFWEYIWSSTRICGSLI